MNPNHSIAESGEQKSEFLSKIISFLGNIRLIIVIIIIVAVFSSINPNYFSINNFYTILMSVTIIGLACIGQPFYLLSGGFDISVGAITLIS